MKQKLPLWHSKLFVWTARLMILVGIMYLIGLTIFGLKSQNTQAEVIAIWERHDGTEYIRVDHGSAYPCQLEVRLIDYDKQLRTFGEFHPCHYKEGDQVRVRYDGVSVMMDHSMWIVANLIMVVAGVYVLRRKVK